MKLIPPAFTPLPPQVIPLLAAAIFDRSLPPTVFLTYARLFASAWANQFRRTEPLDFERELLPLLNISRSQALLHLRLLGAAKLLTWSSDGRHRYVIEFPSLPESAPPVKSKIQDSVDDDGFSLSLPEINPQQHTLESPRSSAATPGEPTNQPASQPSEAAPLEPSAAIHSGSSQADESDDDKDELKPLTVRRCLDRAGVWSDAVERINRLFELNAMRGNPNLPNLGDVLGWIAYCFAFQKRNKIGQPATVLAANLSANRRCPPEYRPPVICSGCQHEVDDCQCDVAPQPKYPIEFLEYAFVNDFTEGKETFWGVCLRCRTFLCSCEAKKE